ncbi:MAG: heavy metal-binding domain-containing protein [Firmicutes bacterium]|nr:heavy metal-binding domain-containing protein [Alicyclobacillaceae bacterium]MCL6497414.1 heavy metal-binding domain-containing protein [Bacillota bacterium]
MVVVSTPFVPGYRIVKVLGMVWGTVVRSRGIGYQVVAGLRSLAGGEINEFTDMLNNARQHAVERMRAEAASLGANAVIAAAFDSSELGQSLSEVLAYGTAVVIEPEGGSSQPVYLT